MESFQTLTKKRHSPTPEASAFNISGGQVGKQIYPAARECGEPAKSYFLLQNRKISYTGSCYFALIVLFYLKANKLKRHIMHWIDWSIIGALFVVLAVTLIVCQRYVKSTADFLAANRCAGRYLLAITSGIAGIGAISIVANFEQYYVAGFSPIWWSFPRR